MGLVIILLELGAAAFWFVAFVIYTSNKKNRNYMLMVAYFMTSISLASLAIGEHWIYNAIAILLAAVFASVGEYIRAIGKQNYVADKLEKLFK